MPAASRPGRDDDVVAAKRRAHGPSVDGRLERGRVDSRAGVAHADPDRRPSAIVALVRWAVGGVVSFIQNRNGKLPAVARVALSKTTW